MRRITVALHGHLPAGYADALAILRQALPLPGATATTSRAHSFRPVTTRRHYPGPRAVQPQVNGDEDRPVPPIYTTAGKSYMIGGEGRNRHL